MNQSRSFCGDTSARSRRPSCPPQGLLERNVEVEHVALTRMRPDKLMEHLSVVIGEQNALKDHVIADPGAVPDRIGDEIDVIAVRDIVFPKHHTTEVILANVGSSSAKCLL